MKKFIFTLACACCAMAASATALVETSCGEKTYTLSPPEDPNSQEYIQYVEYIRELNKALCNEEEGSLVVTAGDGLVFVQP